MRQKISWCFTHISCMQITGDFDELARQLRSDAPFFSCGSTPYMYVVIHVRKEAPQFQSSRAREASQQLPTQSTSRREPFLQTPGLPLCLSPPYVFFFDFDNEPIHSFLDSQFHSSTSFPFPPWQTNELARRQVHASRPSPSIKRCPCLSKRHLTASSPSTSGSRLDTFMLRTLTAIRHLSSEKYSASLFS